MLVTNELFDSMGLPYPKYARVIKGINSRYPSLINEKDENGALYPIVETYPSYESPLTCYRAKPLIVWILSPMEMSRYAQMFPASFIKLRNASANLTEKIAQYFYAQIERDTEDFNIYLDSLPEWSDVYQRLANS